MATATLTRNTNLLRNALRGNSIFSAVSGAILIAASGAVAALMGIASAPLLLVIGISFVGGALLMFYVTSRQPLSIPFARLVFTLDAAWVVASAVILAFDLFGLTTEGRWIVLIVGDIVALFAVAEYVGLRRAG